MPLISTGKLKSVDFYRKIPRDLTEASLSGAGLSIIAALSMMFLFGMELNNYLSVSTSTSVIIDKSSDGPFLRIDFNLSFPALSCEFASVDVSDVLGTNRLNITKTIRKFSIDHDLKPTGSEFYHPGQLLDHIKHGDDGDDKTDQESISLNGKNFDHYSHQHPILVVNFHAPWCYWSNRLKPSWEKAAKIIMERYDPELDGRILLGNVDCTVEGELCRRHHVQGYPTIRIFRTGNDVRDEHGHHNHESYYGDRDTESLVQAMESLVVPIPLDSEKVTSKEKHNVLADDDAKRPAPLAGGCRIEGHVKVKKVPGNLIVSARSGAHSFDASQINMSHYISHFLFGKMVFPKLMEDVKQLVPYFGDSHGQLNGQLFVHFHDIGANVTIEHYLQIVKTEVVSQRFPKKHKVMEHGYTAHSSLVQSVHIPVAKFHYEHSPMQVLITENDRSFSHFITNVCAIIGGVFTVAGILDSVFHHTIRLMKKVELGKNC